METHSTESLPPTHQIVEYRRIPKAEVSLACNNDPQVVSIYWGWWGVNLVYHTKLYPVFSCSGVVLSLKWADFQRGGFTMLTCGAEFETILKRFWSEALSATIRSSHWPPTAQNRPSGPTKIAARAADTRWTARNHDFCVETGWWLSHLKNSSASKGGIITSDCCNEHLKQNYESLARHLRIIPSGHQDPQVGQK